MYHTKAIYKIERKKAAYMSNQIQFIVAQDANHLKLMVEQNITASGPACDLNHINVSNVTDMSFLFQNSAFNGDISGRDVFSVKNMSYMFLHSVFNGNISGWNVSNVKTMGFMFYKSNFNNCIAQWNVSNVEDMSGMFCFSKFNGNINRWDVSRRKPCLVCFLAPYLTKI